MISAVVCDLKKLKLKFRIYRCYPACIQAFEVALEKTTLLKVGKGFNPNAGETSQKKPKTYIIKVS
jgi:hypothetical protein